MAAGKGNGMSVPPEMWQSVLAQATVMTERVIALDESVKRVRELHKEIDANDSVCGDPDCCGEYIEGWTVCQECYCDYPCKTIKVLDGEQG